MQTDANVKAQADHTKALAETAMSKAWLTCFEIANEKSPSDLSQLILSGLSSQQGPMLLQSLYLQNPTNYITALSTLVTRSQQQSSVLMAQPNSNAHGKALLMLSNQAMVLLGFANAAQAATAATQQPPKSQPQSHEYSGGGDCRGFD